MTSRRPLAFLLLALCGCGSGGGSGDPAQLTTMVNADGGAVTVGSGPLAGVVVQIPPGALDRPTRLTVDETRAEARPGYRTISRGVAVGPTECQLRLPATVTLPVEERLLTGNEVLLLLRLPDGSLRELSPATVADGAVTAATAAFGVFWVGERMFDGYSTEGFLPLDDGNEWQFDSGLTLTTAWSFEEPNMQNPFLVRLRLQGEGLDLGWYLQQSPTGSYDLIGEFSEVAGAGHQYLHAPTVLLPLRVTMGQEALAAYHFTGYQPFGSTEPAFEGAAFVRRRADQPSRMATPLGVFDDLLRLRIRTTLVLAEGATRDTVLVLTLARNVGPVALELDGVDGLLAAATVGGAPLPGARR